MEISDTELQLVRDQAVQQARIDEVEKYIPEIFASLKQLTKTVNDIPLTILNCRNDVDKEIKTYMHDKFITDGDLNKLEQKLEKHVDVEVETVNKKVEDVGSKVNKATWMIAGFISAGVTLMYFLKIINFGH